MQAKLYSPENGLTGIEWMGGDVSYRALIVGIDIQKTQTVVHWMSELNISGEWEPRPALQGVLLVTNNTHRSLATLEIVPFPVEGETIGEHDLFEEVFGMAKRTLPGMGIYHFATQALVRKLNLLNPTLNLSLA